ncbi:hypothetical protein L6452_32030 [Arctium lappa]|uniref:Uncharacterized protein n=1 Tax=Arctium lappa TaxID=4217 RepID=A0ACB8Z2K9_ARCLA|nr:hypothetical protein L6452_32030 [Arctium lappa]
MYVFRLKQTLPFNMMYIEDQAQAGEWDEVERYLCGFTKVEDNPYSRKIFFEIRKQKYLEALDRQLRNDREKAVDILVKDLKNEQLSTYGDTKTARINTLIEVKTMIEANPVFRDKLAYPKVKASRPLQRLDQEIVFFFNMKYFEDQVEAGEWDEVERYLCQFTDVTENPCSMQIFFEIRKQKYFKALSWYDRVKAVEIIVKDLKVVSASNEELFKEITHLITFDNHRLKEYLSTYGDTKSSRSVMLVEVTKLIEANPLFKQTDMFHGLLTEN